MSALWLEAAKAQEALVAPALAEGDAAPLLAWLGRNVHRHGRRFLPNALLRRATGEGLRSGPYSDYLTGKYGPLYTL